MSYSTKAAAMFGTISFSNKDPSKNFKPGSGLGHPSRKFACETCRVHKVRCSGERSGCTRCAGLKIKCVYDTVSKSCSRPLRTQSPATGMEFSWSIHSPNKDAPPVNRHNELSAAPQKDSGVVVEVDATVNQPLNDNSSIISPEWLISASTEDESTALQSRSLYSSSHSDDKEILDAPLGDFGDILDWTFEDDGTGNSPNYLVPCASPFDNALHSSPDFAPSGVATDVSLTRPSQASEVLEDRRSSPLSLCSCTSRLSTLLFNLSGYLRQYSQSTPPNSMRACGTQLRHHISLVFAIHGRAIQLGHYLISCESQCMADGSNTVQLVMLIEQLVDLYAGFLEQLSVVSRADDNGAASVEMAIQVRVGEYRVEDVLENRTIIALLVNERLKSITELTVRFRERLQNLPGQAGKCRERLHVAIERLELLRNR